LIVDLKKENDKLFYTLSTPNHNSGNLITNLAKLCKLDITYDSIGLKIIEGEVPCYVNADNEKVYIFRLANTKVANIYPDGRIEMKASIPAISKTLMSQTKDYNIPESKTIVKTYIHNECKFKTDLHTHMNANLHPDVLIAFAIVHQLAYPLYYIKKLGLLCSDKQEKLLAKQREKVALSYKNSQLSGKYLQRQIDDHTYINFASLILENLENCRYNLPKIRNSLAIMKDGQAVFTNLEKVYFYRYVFCKGKVSDKLIKLKDIEKIYDKDVVNFCKQMHLDLKNKNYHKFSLRQHKLLWVARTYQRYGIDYVEISDTSLVKEKDAPIYLKEIHQALPLIEKETGVKLRFLVALRRVPLNLGSDPANYLSSANENIKVLKAVASDPYISGCDIVGEEINDIRDLKSLIKELVKIAKDEKDFVIRIHAGENDCLCDNVYNSIECVKQSLIDNQKMPKVRIGHGLHVASLSSKKGKQLIESIKENNVVLEFQITSNVRLNNLSSLDKHPLKAYLKEGVKCVQGTDGGAIYGSNSIDEQLSLEKMLDLSEAELLQMKKCESEIIQEAKTEFINKEKKFKEEIKREDICKHYQKKIAEQKLDNNNEEDKIELINSLDLGSQITKLDKDKMPIVVVGGSFNNQRHRLSVNKDNLALLDYLLKHGDPNRYCFVFGYELKAYEKYLLENNKGKFDLYVIVPAYLDKNHYEKIKKSKVKVIVSPEKEPMGLYKSFAYEIFKRRKSILLGFDANSAGLNVIQEAKNAKKCQIYISEHSRLLKIKAQSLIGYVNLFKDGKKVAKEILQQ